MQRLIFAASLAVSLAAVAQAAQPTSQQIMPAPPAIRQPQSVEPQTLPPPQNAQEQPQQLKGAMMPGPASHPHMFLKCFKYSSYGTWVKTMGPGYPAYRYTYSGQKDNFPLPAIFQSGSEHTNYTYGIGF